MSARIEGLWITNEETSSHFESGTQKVVLKIEKDSNKNLSARGFFLWNDEYQSEWRLVDIKFDSIAHNIAILDADSDTLKCTMDTKNDILMGAVHLQNKSKNPLSFVRAGTYLETRLLHPRIPDSNGQITYSYNKPEQLDDGLHTESIYNQPIEALSIINLIKTVINQKYGRMKSLLIIKDNKLIVEEYFYGYDRNSLQRINSCTKSITSLLLGIAKDRNKQIELDQPIFTFFPEYDSIKTREKEQITVKHIITMTSGLQWNEYPKEMYEVDDRIKYVLSRPMEARPGEKFLYNSGCSMVVGGIISLFERKQAKAFADKFLFSPLGITKYAWKAYKNGNLEYWNGLQLLPRDMAKIGLLVLNDGKWHNKQVVSKEWIRESIKSHVAESPYFNYGYHWWHRSRNNLQWWEEPQTTSTDEHDMTVARLEVRVF